MNSFGCVYNTTNNKQLVGNIHVRCVDTQGVITECLIVPMISTIVDLVYTIRKIVALLENSDRFDLVR